MKNNKLTVTDYLIKIDGEYVQVKPSLKEARLFVRNIDTATCPKIVELVKRTTTQTTINTYVPKQINTLVIDDLDSDFNIGEEDNE